MGMSVPTANIDAASRFVAHLRDRDIPQKVIESARKCVVDWFAVAIGAHMEKETVAVRAAARALWPGEGRALVLLDDPAPPAAAALVNGTLAHWLDYDDTHVGSLAHLSSSILAAAISVGSGRGAGEAEILSAFLAGFEVGARLGGNGLGGALNARGWHSTGVFATLGATAAAAALIGLDEDGIRRALGAAATQTGGLTASFGTMAKPFHAGKAALNAVISAELAAADFVPAVDLLEPGGGLVRALVQDGTVDVSAIAFDENWEITKNTFKPYASCLLTHPVIDAARSLSAAVRGSEVVKAVAVVNPLARQLAGTVRPKTSAEAKFSTAYCAALGLAGHAAIGHDFSPERIEDIELRTLTERVALVVDPNMPKTAARLEVTLAGGDVLRKDITVALGNPENPISWEQIRTKFMVLTEPVLGVRATELFDRLHAFGRGGALDTVKQLVSASTIDDRQRGLK